MDITKNVYCTTKEQQLYVEDKNSNVQHFYRKVAQTLLPRLNHLSPTLILNIGSIFT
jgi:hypothetical protein